MTFYTPHEIADLFGVSYHAVLRAIDRGELEAERVFNRIKISQDALDAYRDANRVQPRRRGPIVASEPPTRPRAERRGGAGSLAALRAIERGT